MLLFNENLPLSNDFLVLPSGIAKTCGSTMITRMVPCAVTRAQRLLGSRGASESVSCQALTPCNNSLAPLVVLVLLQGTVLVLLQFLVGPLPNARILQLNTVFLTVIS